MSSSTAFITSYFDQYFLLWDYVAIGLVSKSMVIYLIYIIWNQPSTTPQNSFSVVYWFIIDLSTQTFHRHQSTFVLICFSNKASSLKFFEIHFLKPKSIIIVSLVSPQNYNSLMLLFKDEAELIENHSFLFNNCV